MLVLVRYQSPQVELNITRPGCLPDLYPGLFEIRP
jgi:hypothetical protein